MKHNVLLAFDIGGSSIKYTLDHLKTIQIKKFEVISKSQVLQFISDLANKCKADEICISAPGIIDPPSGNIWGYSAVANWKTKNIYAELKPLLRNLNTKIHIDNDGNCALLGNIYNLKKPIKSGLSIVLGTGIGAAYYSDNKIQRGHTNCMCELGMMRYAVHSSNNTSMELSTNALCKVINQKFKTHYNGLEVLKLYDDSNSCVKQIVDQWVFKNAIFIYNMIWAFDPEYIFIAGGISVNPIFKKLLRSNLQILFKEIKMKMHTKIIFATGGNKSNLLGALLLSQNYQK